MLSNFWSPLIKKASKFQKLKKPGLLATYISRENSILLTFRVKHFYSFFFRWEILAYGSIRSMLSNLAYQECDGRSPPSDTVVCTLRNNNRCYPCYYAFKHAPLLQSYFDLVLLKYGLCICANNYCSNCSISQKHATVLSIYRD